ncbi:Cysteine-rich CWC [Cupriavidus sp. OV038]|uniref:cysteine-rich CWC family protein n=1 Tax=unclassified Cupriavidus TaxID=2640874 RepID=UPI0008F28146|nr:MULTISPECIES: cysteine-rich CWC family protein [unclassified Cupriavidus]SFC73083.1 Cysteine-rich CWC [Cupriavidus sp. OV038]SFO75385.1 Cysteine-rich CWC [Cupriavidus sp. OV096]
MTDPSTIQTGQLRPVERCSRCGAAFACGYVAGLPECWCASQPLLPARQIVAGQHCLCPDCLKARRDASQNT